MRKALLLTIALLFYFFISRANPGVVTIYDTVIYRHTFVVCIGIDTFHTSNSYFNYTLQYARSDAEKFLSYLKTIIPRKDSILLNPEFNPLNREKENKRYIIYDSLFSITLLDKNATFDSLQKSLESLSKKANPEDLFIFYYSGKGATDSLNNPYLLLYNKDSLDESSNKILGIQLKTLFKKIQCRNQITIIDANKGESLIDKLIFFLVEKDPYLLKSMGMNRVFISTKGNIAFESEIFQGGLLTKILTSLPDTSNIFGLVSNLPQVTKSTEYNIFNQEKKLFRTGYTYIVSEKDIFKYFSIFDDDTKLSRGTKLMDETNLKDTSRSSLKNYALIIGTNIYQNWPALKNPILDASTIADELSEKYHFKVDLLLDPTREEILRKLMDLQREAYDSLSQLLLFISGHGNYIEETKTGYLVPKDGLSHEKDPFMDSFIPYYALQKIVNNIRCPHVLVVLDVCYGGTFDEESAWKGPDFPEYSDISKEELIKRKIKYQSKLYVTSGGKEYVPDGRPGYHSPFAYKFIEALITNYDKNEVLTYPKLCTFLEKLQPEPRHGTFRGNQPGGDFLFVPNGTSH